MQPTASPTRGVLLVGSVPLANAEEVFRAVSAALGDRLRRIPDGETGARLDWFVWQVARFEACSQLEAAPAAARGYRTLPKFRLRAGVDPASIDFGRLGYADAAKASYETFARLQREGAVPRGVRFQVCLPSPLAPASAFSEPESLPAIAPAYEAALLRELDEIAAAIPQEALAIQWDVAVEFSTLDGLGPPPTPEVKQAILDRLVRVGNRVPHAVELGYHLCYGDYGHKHFKEPTDTGVLVEVANAIAGGLTHPLTWLHLPVPRDRDDEAYFAPLRGLRLSPATELYLGLVHHTDGVAGTRRRLATAERIVPREFGIATECGFGRRPPETIPELLRIHAAVARGAADGS
ncbi:MAG TPA: hypothetical protein VFE37_14895 [Chloroflexota bacterium]|nr:hypothetical protein [Chloroflexota bacterium]